jgi:hypothetical protein
LPTKIQKNEKSLKNKLQGNITTKPEKYCTPKSQPDKTSQDLYK